MHRASNTFSVLQAIAAVVAVATILWSLGMTSFRFAEAANVTSFSDTLSTSEPSVASDHTIVFTATSGVPNTGTISIDFGGNFTGTSSIDATDITFDTTSTLTVGDNCTGVDVSAVWSGDVLTFTMCAGGGESIAAYGTTTVQIGTGSDQLVNPTAGTYEIDLSTSAGDTGSTRVAIVPVVTVTASVDTIFEFIVAGVATGQTVNGTTTGTTTTATAINFGTLSAGVATTAAQDLTVRTNAKNGFTVTVIADGQLSSAVGADIDSFANGGNQSSPIGWTAPSASVGSENTYGHWGLTSDDTDIFAATETYVAASTSPVTIFTHDGPVDGVASPSTGTSTTRVGYTVEISALQEAANDYTAILTYVATPVF